MLEQYKQQPAERAVQFVASGMIVGFGTGSTAMYAIRRLGQLLRDGWSAPRHRGRANIACDGRLGGAAWNSIARGRFCATD